MRDPIREALVRTRDSLHALSAQADQAVRDYDRLTEEPLPYLTRDQWDEARGEDRIERERAGL